MEPTLDLATQIASAKDALLRQGWCVVREALPREGILALDTDLAPSFEATPFCRGAFYGETTKRFGRLLARSDRVAALVQHGLIQGVAEAVLSPWCDCIQLNVAQAIAIHPGAPAQFPHRDQDMWRAPIGEAEYLVNVIWPLTPFTAANGATRLWPGSHGLQACEQVVAAADSLAIAAELGPGDALIFLGSTLHAAGANRTDTVRRAIVIGYSLGWLKPYENQSLAYPPAIAASFAPELAALVGYRQHRPNLGNFEGQCPSALLNHSDSITGAIDALTADQTDAVNAHRDAQAIAP